MIPAGRYKGYLENPVLEESSTKGTPCIKATARICDVGAGSENNSRIEVNLWLTENTTERAIQSLIYAGCTFPPKPGETEPNLEDFAGCGSQEVEFQIEHETYTPEKTAERPDPKPVTRPRVQWINRVGESRASKPMDDAKKKMVAKNFAGAIASARAKMAAGGVKGGVSFDAKELEAGDRPLY